MRLDISDASICVENREDGFVNMNEVLEELRRVHKQFDTHSMNEHKLFLKGRHSMLADVISYLERTI